MVTGAIIAGGFSRRFGEEDKAVAPIDGTPMIRHVGNRLAGIGRAVDPGAEAASNGEGIVDNLVISCRGDQREAIASAMSGYPLEVSYVEDQEPDQGPTAGIGNACRGASDEVVLVVACDMPFVDPGFLLFLRERLKGYDAVVPQLDDEWFQTTQAVYRASPMAAACEATLERGDRKVLAALSTLEYTVVDDAEIRSVTTERTFENVNTKADLEAAQRRYRTCD